MKPLSFTLGRFLTMIAGLMLCGSFIAHADTVKLKTGESLEGKMTYEGSDYIKFEVSVSATIKDTKVIPRDQIAEIIKAAPDDEALSELRKKLPAPSLMSAPAYRSLIDSGPKKFLTDFPASQHKAEVEKILADLQSELDKVERGSVKLEGEWVTAQEKAQFKTLTDSRIRAVLMKRKMAQGDMLGALRDFEILDEQFYGTPAHAAAIPEVQKLLPAFGQRLTRARQDVEFRNQKWEQDKALLDEVARAQVEGARAQELANFERAIAREKEAGVKWLSINDNSAEGLTSAISLLKSEIERLNEIDIDALKASAELLVKADQAIAENKLEEAKRLIDESSSTGGGSSSKKTFGGGSKKSRGSSSKSSSSYVGALSEKIKDAETAMALAKKQQADAAKGAKASSVIKAGENKAPLISADQGEAVSTDEKPTDQGSALTGLMASGSKPEEKEDADDEKKKRPVKKERPSSSKNSEDEEDGPAQVAEDEGGGLNFQVIMMIVAGVMVVALVVMKALGIGGAKEGGNEG